MPRYEHFDPTSIPPRSSSNRLSSPPTSSPRQHRTHDSTGAAPPLHSPDFVSPLPSPDNYKGKTHAMEPSYKHARNSSIMSASDQTHLTWSPAKEKILRGPFDYLVNIPGKNIRKALIDAFNQWLQVPPESLDIINRVVAILHTASLLIDDVEDSSELRRGIPVAHAIYGTAQTLNTANYMYFVALQELVKLNNPTALHIYTEEMCNLHRGQGMDLFWRDTLTVPTEEEYLEMVGNKTGGLFRLAIKLMQAASPTGKDCVSLAGLLGVIYQIRDDYMNLWSEDYSTNKGMCEDLTEGKFSFPIIHSIRANPNNLVLINILKQKTKDETVKRYAVGYMEQTGSFIYCRKILEELIENAMHMIQEVDGGDGGSQQLLAILEKMSIE